MSTSTQTATTTEGSPPPDIFEYSIPDFPLHLKPWNPEQCELDKKQQQKRTREFFRFVRTASGGKPIQHDTIMSNGESVGAASLWHIHHHYEKRSKGGSVVEQKSN